MKKLMLMILWVPYSLFAQKQENKFFYRMVDGLLDHSVDEVGVNDDISPQTIVLDARSLEEYAVSHLKEARYVGYDDFDMIRVADLDKEAEILVYCSVGYRSEKIAKKLKNAGYENVYNLYGGLFDWANKGKELVDSLGNQTKKVHGYNRIWGKWLDGPEVVY